MLDNFLNIILQIKIPLILLGIIFMALSFFWKKLFKFLKLRPYKAVQKVHYDEISRLSGFMIYLFFTTLCVLDITKSSLIINIIIAFLPVVIISLKEDLLHNTSPKSRIFSMILSCLIFFYINPITFPIVDIPLLRSAINFYPISIIFFTFSFLVLMNGMNLIDGVNGLVGFTALFLLLAISIIAFNIGDIYIMNIAILFAAPLIIFLFFNFPFGKVFMGDLGAYFYGFIIAILITYLFGKHNFLLTWGAVLLLFYPCMELLFSFIRKIKNHKSPFDPDNKHLHSLIYKRFQVLNNPSSSNSLTTLSLIYFWITPFLVSLIIPLDLLSTLGFILLLCISYIYIYKLVNVKY